MLTDREVGIVFAASKVGRLHFPGQWINDIWPRWPASSKDCAYVMANRCLKAALKNLSEEDAIAELCPGADPAFPLAQEIRKQYRAIVRMLPRIKARQNGKVN